MDRNESHFELFVRRQANGPWAPAFASDDRLAVIEAALAARAASPGMAVRVCRKSADRPVSEFRICAPGACGARPARGRWRPASLVAAPEPAGPSCVRPEDLYGPAAREQIGRVLAAWLAHHAVTPFELLHRSDLAERLEACKAELSAAIDNATAAEASRGEGIEAAGTTLAGLVQQAIDRLVRAAAGQDEGASLTVGMAIAERLKAAPGWRAKVETLLGLIASGERAGPAAELARRRLQQPLAEALGGDGDLNDILGVTGLGEQVLTLVQIAATPTACAAVRTDKRLRRALPPLRGFPARLAVELQISVLLTRTRRAIAARALRILTGEMRLWPDAPHTEIDAVQAAFALLRADPRLVNAADVDAAEAARWRLLASPAFVQQRLSLNKGALEDADLLLDLANAARGTAAIAAFGRRLTTVVGGETFMAETRFGPDCAKLRRAVLARLRNRVASSALDGDAKADTDFLLLRLCHLIDADGVGVGRGPILIAHRGG